MDNFNWTSLFTWIEFKEFDLLFLERLFLAALLGGSIGWEREYSNKQAGFRTHLLVSLGSCLLMLLSIYGFLDWIDHPNVRYDPARLAAQVINGIGFLAAGAILVRPDLVVSGLTTSASLWVSMGIGLAVGSGNYFMAIVTTILVLFVLIILPKFEKRMRRKEEKAIQLYVMDRPGVLGAVTTQLGKEKINIAKISMMKDADDDERVHLNIVVKNTHNLSTVLDELRKTEGVIEVIWQNSH